MLEKMYLFQNRIRNLLTIKKVVNLTKIRNTESIKDLNIYIIGF